MTDEKKKDEGTFDMYHFFSRKDVILAIVFLVAFLIFTLALQFLPQPV